MNWFKKLFNQEPTIIKYRKLMKDPQYKWLEGSWISRFDTKTIYVLNPDRMETHTADKMHRMTDWRMVQDLLNHPIKYTKIEKNS